MLPSVHSLDRGIENREEGDSKGDREGGRGSIHWVSFISGILLCKVCLDAMHETGHKQQPQRQQHHVDTNSACSTLSIQPPRIQKKQHMLLTRRGQFLLHWDVLSMSLSLCLPSPLLARYICGGHFKVLCPKEQGSMATLIIVATRRMSTVAKNKGGGRAREEERTRREAQKTKDNPSRRA